MTSQTVCEPNKILMKNTCVSQFLNPCGLIAAVALKRTANDWSSQIYVKRKIET